jgi:5'-nucleotidase
LEVTPKHGPSRRRRSAAPSWPLDLGRARILIANDDGIQAPGLKVLEDVARQLSPDVWVVAPETEQSAAGHSLTLARPLYLREVSERRYAVDGTPTDCVMLAVNHLLRDHRPDLVLSGVNRGGNLGEDVTYSGTVAAAMEATLLGLPAIAFSQDIAPGEHPHWATAEHHAALIIRRLVQAGWPAGVLININFPPVPADKVAGIAVARQGRRKTGNHFITGTDPRGRPYHWIAGLKPEDTALTGTDLAALIRGAIAVTPIQMDMSHRPTIAALGKALGARPKASKRR